MISPASLPRIAFSLLSSVSPSFHQTSDPVSALFAFIVSFVVLRLLPAINSFMYYVFGEERERELYLSVRMSHATFYLPLCTSEK